ncbi:MAG TPA: hypothetical protein VL475_04015 [Planctomycetaceae bacterium]|jgi:hypothetical protein|nr:hypothetical protein [Planctomycetaceae bacterium]
MWDQLLLAAGAGPLTRIWFALPLIVAISLVYSASRYEAPPVILRRAGRLSLTITGFMLAVLAVLVVLSHGL